MPTSIQRGFGQSGRPSASVPARSPMSLHWEPSTRSSSLRVESESSNVSAQRQSPRDGQVPEIHDHAATGIAGMKIGAYDGVWVAERRAVEFAVAHSHHFTDGVHNVLAFATREFHEARSRLREFLRQRHLTSYDQRLRVVVELPRTPPVASAAEFEISEMPAQREAQRVKEFGALAGGFVLPFANG